MAKIIGGSPIGFLSGKEGGRVFSHNKAGQYTRQYVIPVNPATIAQEAARQKFGAASGGYHHLSAAEKSLWTNFANAVFSPKVGVNNGQFSGFNAYTSLAMNVNVGQGLTQTGTMTINGSAPATAATYGNFAFNDQPPTFALQPNIGIQGGGVAGLVLTAGKVSQDGDFEVTFEVDGAPVGGTDIDDFTDGQGRKFGIMIQMSNSTPQDGMFFSNPNKYTLGCIAPPSLDLADRTGVETIEWASTTNVNPAHYQGFPKNNDFVELSAWSLGDVGMLACLGKILVEVDTL